MEMIDNGMMEPGVVFDILKLEGWEDLNGIIMVPMKIERRGGGEWMGEVVSVLVVVVVDR